MSRSVPVEQRKTRLVRFLLTERDYIRLLEMSRGEDLSPYAREVILDHLWPGRTPTIDFITRSLHPCPYCGRYHDVSEHEVGSRVVYDGHGATVTEWYPRSGRVFVRVECDNGETLGVYPCKILRAQ